MKTDTAEHRYPAFMVATYSSAEPARLETIDGWNVRPTGDDALDEALGAIHAEETVKWAHREGNTSAVSFVIASIFAKVHTGEIKMGAMEIGFMNRIAQFAYCGARN